MKSKIISILALLLMAVTGARASPVQKCIHKENNFNIKQVK